MLFNTARHAPAGERTRLISQRRRSQPAALGGQKTVPLDVHGGLHRGTIIARIIMKGMLRSDGLQVGPTEGRRRDVHYDARR
jgi:hypothetical protein